MKLFEISLNNDYHNQIKVWITAAKFAAKQEINRLLHAESTTESKWFINVRGNRLKQLADEIFTVKLLEASDGNWTVDDFKGRAHSDIISQALHDVNNYTSRTYRTIKTKLIKKTVTDYENAHDVANKGNDMTSNVHNNVDKIEKDEI